MTRCAVSEDLAVYEREQSRIASREDAIESRAHEILTNSIDLMGLLEQRDSGGMLADVAELVASALAYAKAVRAIPATNTADAVVRVQQAQDRLIEAADEASESLVADALAPATNGLTTKSYAEQLFDAESWDDGDDGSGP